MHEFLLHAEIKTENRSKLGKTSDADIGDEIVPISKLYYSDWMQKIFIITMRYRSASWSYL